METAQKILMVIFKGFSINHTVTSLAKGIGLSRVGTWKVLKKLETEKLLNLNRTGSGKTSTYIIELNWNNILTEKNLGLMLTKEAQDNQRWIDNFRELEDDVCFLILFGSILHSPKEANDIDILAVADKKNLSKVNEAVSRIQKTQVKKIHLTNVTETELKEELGKQNKIFIDSIKKGVVLFKQEKFVKFVKELKR